MLSEWLKWTKKQKKLRTAENNSALRKMSLYYDQTIRELKRNGKAYDMQGFFKYYGIYNAYLELRHATVYIVNAKKKGKHENSSRLDRNEDVDEAEKVGKILIDAMMKYLLDGAEMGEIVEPATYYHA